jgi:site-specific DNA-cytosine methylase
LKILVACEESQAVTIELRKLGHEAYSCDILPCSGGHPEWHLQEDVVPLLNQTWDMIIAFPPCTYLTVTGNRWFNEEKYGDNAIKRKEDRKDAVNFFMLFANANCEKIAIENPVGIMSSQWRKPNQIIQPWMFGDGFEKKTCLWLKGLPNLTPTNIVVPPARKIFDSGKSMPTLGIAKAMAKQWTMIKE